LANDIEKRSVLDQITAAAMQPASPAPGIFGADDPSRVADPSGALPPVFAAAVKNTPTSLADAPATSAGSIDNLEAHAASPDNMAARTAATAQTEKNDHPSFLSKLGRVAGDFVGIDHKASLGDNLRNLAARTGEGLAMAAGTPQQKQIAEEESQVPLKLAQIGNEREYRQALVGTKATANDINQQKADQAQEKAAGTMRLKGYVPDEKTPGAYRPMNEDEILADPVLSKNQDLASAAAASKNAGAELSKARYDALMNPNNPTLLLKAKQIENTYKLALAHLGMQMHTQARQDQEFTYNYGQAPGGANANPTPAGAGGAGRATAQPGGLGLENAPDMMMVNPATGLPIPMKMLSTLKPTPTEQNRADFAASAMHSADKIQQLVEQAKAQVGPFSGRVAELMAKAGLGDQFNQEMQNYVRFTQSAATAAHTGRFSVPILDKMDKMIGPEMNSDQLSGAIDSIKGQMAPYADAGWKPTVWEYRAWLGGAGKTPSGKTAPADTNVVEYERGTDGKLHPKQKGK